MDEMFLTKIEQFREESLQELCSIWKIDLVFYCVLLSRSTHLIFSITRNVRLYFCYLFTFTSQNMEPTSLLCLISFPRQLLKSLKMFVGLFMTSGTDKDYECSVATANVKQRCLIKVSQHIL